MINTERKENLIEAILEYCEDIITVKDLNLNYIAYNKSFAKIIGADSNTKIVGCSVYDVMPKSCASIVVENAQKVINELRSRTFTFVLERPCASKIVKQTITPIIKHGKVESLLSISSDVTIEESLKAQIVEKNYQVNTLMKNLPFYVYMKDKNRNLIVATETSRNFVLNGIDILANDIKINIHDNELETINEDNYALENKKILIKEKVAFDEIGKQHYYRVHKAPILTDNDDINGVVTIVQNIDKEKQLENQKNLFLATLSHDLKNPLQAQISSLNMIYQQCADKMSAEYKEILELVIESANYMKDMLCTLMKTCKESNGVIRLDRTYFDIENLVLRSAKEIQNWASNKNIEIIIDSKIKTNKEFWGDELQLKRVVGNLFNNAINYAYENTVVKISLELENDCVILNIENTSAVIPEDLKEHIFDKFVCGNNLQNTNNIGLGLYFCKKIIDVHNGNIELISNGNHNAFKVTLPFLTTKNAQLSEVVL